MKTVEIEVGSVRGNNVALKSGLILISVFVFTYTGVIDGQRIFSLSMVFSVFWVTALEDVCPRAWCAKYGKNFPPVTVHTPDLCPKDEMT